MISRCGCCYDTDCIDFMACVVVVLVVLRHWFEVVAMTGTMEIWVLWVELRLNPAASEDVALQYSTVLFPDC